MPLLKRLLLPGLLLFSYAVCAQTPLLLKWEPHLMWNYKASEQWSYKFRVGGLHTYLDASGGEDSRAVTDRVEARAYATYAAGKGKFTLGYMYRITTPLEEARGYEHRFMEQYAFSIPVGAYQLDNRILLEQRVSDDEYINRLRYKLGFSFPLAGSSLEPGESYLEVSDDEVFAFNAAEQSLEHRLYTGMGWLFINGDKLNLGLELRLAGPGVPEPENALHFITTYQFSY